MPNYNQKKYLKLRDFFNQVQAAEIQNKEEYFRVYVDHKGWHHDPRKLYNHFWPGWNMILFQEKNELELHIAAVQRKFGKNHKHSHVTLK